MTKDFKGSVYWSMWGDLVSFHRRLYVITLEGYDDRVLGAVNWFNDRWTGSAIEKVAKQCCFDLMVHLLGLRDSMTEEPDQVVPLEDSGYWTMWADLVSVSRALYPMEMTDDWIAKVWTVCEEYGERHASGSDPDELGRVLVVDLCGHLCDAYDERSKAGNV